MPTNIEWTDKTWNPITGCTKVGPGCDHCYMFRDYPRLKAMGNAGYPADPEIVTLLPDRLTAPYPWNKTKPEKVFVCSMADLFHSDVPFEFIARVFKVMVDNPHITFQVLTKRPGRMVQFQQWAEYKLPVAGWPKNVWAGTSVEMEWDGSRRLTARLDLLAQVQAEVRFLSYEPMLGPLDLRRWLEPQCLVCRNAGCFRCDCEDCQNEEPTLSWVIAGGESGPAHRSINPQWARSMRDQCVAAHVPFFFKQWGESMQAPEAMNFSQAAEWAGRAPLVHWSNGHTMVTVGRKAAGALLDGREWREFPANTR